MSGIDQYHEWNRSIPRVEQVNTKGGTGQYHMWKRPIFWLALKVFLKYV
jgi:hypothetical protein